MSPKARHSLDQNTQQQQQQQFGQSTGGGLGSSDVVKNLPQTQGGEGITKEQYEAQKAQAERKLHESTGKSG